MHLAQQINTAHQPKQFGRDSRTVSKRSGPNKSYKYGIHTLQVEVASLPIPIPIFTPWIQNFILTGFFLNHWRSRPNFRFKSIFIMINFYFTVKLTFCFCQRYPNFVFTKKHCRRYYKGLINKSVDGFTMYKHVAYHRRDSLLSIFHYLFHWTIKAGFCWIVCGRGLGLTSVQSSVLLDRKVKVNS